MKITRLDKMYRSWSEFNRSPYDEEKRVIRAMNKIYPKKQVVNMTTDEWEDAYEHTKMLMRTGARLVPAEHN